MSHLIRQPNIPQERALPLEWLGNLLVANRKEQGLTQQELASRADKHQQVIARWESENYRGASLENLVAVAAALEIRVGLVTEPVEIPLDPVS